MFEFITDLFQTNAITIYITDKYIQIIETNKKNASKPEVVSHIKKELPDDIVINGEVLNQKMLANEITDALNNAQPKPIRTKNCYLVFPEEQIYENIFFLPKTLNGDAFQKELDKLISENVPVAFHDLKSVYHTWEDGDKKVVAVNSVLREVLAQYYEVLKFQCGLKPIMAESPSLSLIRNSKRNFNLDEGMILIDMRNDYLYWYLIWKQCTYDSGIVRLQSEGQEYLTELVNSLASSINSFQRFSGKKFKEIILSCDQNRCELFNDVLAKSLKIPASIVKEYKFGNDEFKVVGGLGLRAMGVDTVPEIDLLKKWELIYNEFINNK